jgi:hypothetical protein
MARKQPQPAPIAHRIETVPTHDQFGDCFAVRCSCGWAGPANGNAQQASAMRAQHQQQTGHGY